MNTDSTIFSTLLEIPGCKINSRNPGSICQILRIFFDEICFDSDEISTPNLWTTFGFLICIQDTGWPPSLHKLDGFCIEFCKPVSGHNWQLPWKQKLVTFPYVAYNFLGCVGLNLPRPTEKFHVSKWRVWNFSCYTRQIQGLRDIKSCSHSKTCVYIYNWNPNDPWLE